MDSQNTAVSDDHIHFDDTFNGKWCENMSILNGNWLRNDRIELCVDTCCHSAQFGETEKTMDDVQNASHKYSNALQVKWIPEIYQHEDVCGDTFNVKNDGIVCSTLWAFLAFLSRIESGANVSKFRSI